MKFTLRSILLKPIFLASLLCLVGIAHQAFAQIDEAAKDFRLLSGVVIMPVEDEFLIDLDASQGVSKGDLFSVIQPGEKIIHPETGEILGTLDSVKAIIEVTQIKEGYSHVRPLEKGTEVARGDAVRRFAKVQVAFWDYTGRGKKVFDNLKTALPELDWVGYDAAQAERPERSQTAVAERPPLLFVLTEEGLEARGASGQLLHAYEVGAQSAAKTEPETSGILRSEQAQIDDVWYGPRLNGKPVGIASGDVDGDGANEIAVLYEDRLELLRLSGRVMEKLATMGLPTMVEGLAIDSADLDGNSSKELYVTGARQDRLYSLRVSFSGKRLVVKEEGLHWYFRTLPLPEEGPVLLAQKMGDLEHDFEGPVFRVAEQGNRLIRGKSVDLPRRLAVLGFLPFSANGKEILYARLSPSDDLEVLDTEGDSLWQAPEPFGGTEVALTRQDPSAPARSPEEMRPVWIQIRMTRADDGSLVVPVNEGGRLMSKTRSFKRSYLTGQKWDGYALRETWRTQPLDGALVDYRLNDVDNDGEPEIVMAVSFGGKGFFAKDRATLVVIEGL